LQDAINATCSDSAWFEEKRHNMEKVWEAGDEPMASKKRRTWTANSGGALNDQQHDAIVSE
jgi:hypothetical protein